MQKQLHSEQQWLGLWAAETVEGYGGGLLEAEAFVEGDGSLVGAGYVKERA